MTITFKKTLGKVLIWIGVFAWVPYIYLSSIGSSPSVWPYLIVHLGCSFGGGKLHGPLLEEDLSIGKTRRKLSKILIYLGVIAILPYVYLNNTGYNVSITPYLIPHLVGIFGGILVRVSVSVSQVAQRRARQ